MHVGGIRANHTPEAADLTQARDTSFNSRLIPLDRKSSAELSVWGKITIGCCGRRWRLDHIKSKAEAGLESSMCIVEVLEGF